MELVKMITTKEAAKIAGVSTSAIQQRIHRGSLKAEKVHGRWMIEEAHLREVLEIETRGRPSSYPFDVNKLAAKLGLTVQAVTWQARTKGIEHCLGQIAELRARGLWDD